MERFRIPGILGLILGGYLIGPAAFNLIDGASLKGLGTIGLLYLMFLAGLELDLGSFGRNRSVGVRFGLLTFAFPFALGVIAPSGWRRGPWCDRNAPRTLVTYPIVQRRA
jgi:Kef-type K+ transport system membrane component KefB